MKKPLEARRRYGRSGTTIFILFIAVTVLFILGFSFSYVLTQRRRIIVKHGEDFTAYYMAQAGVRKALWVLRNAFTEDLVSPKNPKPKEILETNEVLLNLLDMERAREWARTYDLPEGEVMAEGKAHVLMEFLGVSRNEFSTYLDRVERIPPGLEQYREKRDPEGETQFGLEPLGGWTGKVRIVSTGTYRGTRRIIEVIKDVKVTDITPPAPDHTLFIHGKNTEYLKGPGKFQLSNLDLPQVILDLIHELAMKVNEVLRLELTESKERVLANVSKINEYLTTKFDEGDVSGALKIVHDLAQHANDENIRDMVDNIILSLNPRDWGRIRTNGVLHVYLPFFEADDIINYFADTSIFGHQRPEVGYLFHQYRLHDPYLSVYTHYEGYVYKNYRRLNPLALGPSKEPQPVPPQRYTINTRMNYVQRHPEREEVPGLDRLRKHGKKYCHRLYKTPETLWGRKNDPIVLEGIWYFQEKLTLGGPFVGRGLIVCEKDISIVAGLTKGAKNASLGLVSLNGVIAFAPEVSRFRVEAGLYGHNGFTGTPQQQVDILGNLICENFNREKQPRYVSCRFDPDLKNHMCDNIVGVVGRRALVWREIGAAERPRSIRPGSLPRSIQSDRHE